MSPAPPSKAPDLRDARAARLAAQHAGGGNKRRKLEDDEDDDVGKRVAMRRPASTENLFDTGDLGARRVLLREAAAISLLSLIPPDRVGLIRKLRLGHTLKRAEGGGWRLDLTKQRVSLDASSVLKDASSMRQRWIDEKVWKKWVLQAKSVLQVLVGCGRQKVGTLITFCGCWPVRSVHRPPQNL